MPATHSLAELSPSTKGRIDHFELPQDDEIRVRTLGVCTGMEVEVLQNGDPLILRAAGTRLGIARRIATGVYISGSAQPSEPQRHAS